MPFWDASIISGNIKYMYSDKTVLFLLKQVAKQQNSYIQCIHATTCFLMQSTGCVGGLSLFTL